MNTFQRTNGFSFSWTKQQKHKMNEQTKKLKRFFPLKCPRRHQILQECIVLERGVSLNLLSLFYAFRSVYPFWSTSEHTKRNYNTLVCSCLSSLFLRLSSSPTHTPSNISFVWRLYYIFIFIFIYLCYPLNILKTFSCSFCCRSHLPLF